MVTITALPGSPLMLNGRRLFTMAVMAKRGEQDSGCFSPKNTITYMDATTFTEDDADSPPDVVCAKGLRLAKASHPASLGWYDVAIAINPIEVPFISAETPSYSSLN